MFSYDITITFKRGIYVSLFCHIKCEPVLLSTLTCISQVQQVSLHIEVLFKLLNVEPHPPRESCLRMVGGGLLEGGVYFVQLEPDNQCRNNSRGGRRIQGNTVLVHIVRVASSGTDQST